MWIDAPGPEVDVYLAILAIFFSIIDHKSKLGQEGFQIANQPVKQGCFSVCKGIPLCRLPREDRVLFYPQEKKN